MHVKTLAYIRSKSCGFEEEEMVDASASGMAGQGIMPD